MERNFNRIYEAIYKEENEFLNSLRRKNNTKITIGSILGALTIIFAYLYMFQANKTALFLAIFMAVITLIVLFICYKDYARYKETFKEHVIKKMISTYSAKLSYNPKSGVNRKEYDESNFEGAYDTFQTEDCVLGTIGESSILKMSQVKTEVRANDKEDKDKYEVSFIGLYGFVKLEKSANTNIDILRNSNGIANYFRGIKNKIEYETTRKPLNYKIYPKEKVEIDSAEFEKYYDFYASDKIMALRIVTSELIEKFVRIKDKSNYKLELKIVKDRLYFRYGCGNIFEPTRFKESLDYRVLNKYFNILDIPINLIESIIKHINEVEK